LHARRGAGKKMMKLLFALIAGAALCVSRGSGATLREGASSALRSELATKGWSDGTRCFICSGCTNSATWWHGDVPFWACGKEPKWSDGRRCALGTTCKQCMNEATYWPTKWMTACGKELSDGSSCVEETTCNLCKNKATFWYSKWWYGGKPGKQPYACGKEPKWSDGEWCIQETSCKQCMNEATYWPSKRTPACGVQPPYK
jgi:hypothetical protein